LPELDHFVHLHDPPDSAGLMRFAVAHVKDGAAGTTLNLLMMTFLARRPAMSLIEMRVERSVLTMMIRGSHDLGLW